MDSAAPIGAATRQQYSGPYQRAAVHGDVPAYGGPRRTSMPLVPVRYSPAMPSNEAPDEATIRARLHDAPRLLALRLALREVADAPEPRARPVAGPRLDGGATVALLPGSFNPPTVAHLALARAGLERGADAVLFTLATRTIDKEAVTGAGLEDRLLLLELLAARDARLGVLLINRGLYVDQAVAVHAAFPSLREIVFLVGYDKIAQIFDPSYYDDRDAALERLFALAGFLVAPRADAGPVELEDLLGRPENRRFAAAVRPLSLPPALRDVASSTVRAQVSGEVEPGGERATPVTKPVDPKAGRRRATSDEQLPTECRVFVTETSAYAPEPLASSYRRRLALLDKLEALAATGVPNDALRAQFLAAARSHADTAHFERSS
jgi:nicotinic acid mononucleotide adenylyltransferase